MRKRLRMVFWRSNNIGGIQMKSTILESIPEKADYLNVAEAVTGGKTEYTEEEAAQLLAVYEDKMAAAYGLTDKTLDKLFMVLDTADRNSKEPMKTARLAHLLSEADQTGLVILVELCRNRNSTPALAIQAKEAALAGEMDQGLALALARAALDALAGRRDIKAYRADINALLDFLGGADESKFYQASMFLWGVRAKWMN